jgi:hypothetical protein
VAVSAVTTRPAGSETVTAASAPAGKPAIATSMRFSATAGGGGGGALSLPPPFPQPESERPVTITAIDRSATRRTSCALPSPRRIQHRRVIYNRWSRPIADVGHRRPCRNVIPPEGPRMEKRKLGKTGYEVAPLAFGGNVFGWTVDEPTSFLLLDTFVDAGFNLIDTADSYSRWVPGHTGGESEAIIGRWIANRGRHDDVVIATKIGSDMGLGYKCLRREYIMQGVEQSLQRLHVDAIDLYQSHWDDERRHSRRRSKRTRGSSSRAR